MVFKGEGGEVEIKPHATTRCLRLHGGILEQFYWPRSLPDKPPPASDLGAAALRELWRGDGDRYGHLAVIHTAAAALLLMDRAPNSGAAIQLADRMWTRRDRERFG